MNYKTIKETIDLINTGPYELNKILSIELVDIARKISKKGYEYTALHFKYLDHASPENGWKDRFIRADIGEARLIVHSGPYSNTDRYHVRALKNGHGYWPWCNIDPVSPANAEKEIL